MTRFLQGKTGRRLAIRAALAGAAAVTAVSCTKVDNLLGEDYVPDQQVMQMARDTFYDFNTYALTIDSMAATGWEYGIFGSMIEPLYGRTTCGTVAQFLPTGFEDSKVAFGPEPTIDSVILYLGIGSGYGDSTYYNTVTMYPIQNRLHYDSTYYSNFGRTQLKYDPVPVTTFQSKFSKTQVKQYLNPEYWKQYLDTSGQVYKYDTLFHKRHRGFYFKVEPLNGTPGTPAGALAKIDYETSSVVLYYHNKRSPKPDTSYVEYSFYNGDYSTNTNITTVEHDYTYADPVKGVDPARLNDTLTTSPVTYVQGLAGLMTYVEIPWEVLESLKRKVEGEGYDARKLSINRAALTAYIDDVDKAELDKAVERFGLYFDYATNWWIPDYNPYYEQSITMPFGGYVERALFCYEMDITSYVQKLLTGQYAHNRVYLAPGINYADVPNHTSLQGKGSARPMRLVVTYTMIK